MPGWSIISPLVLYTQGNELLLANKYGIEIGKLSQFIREYEKLRDDG